MDLSEILNLVLGGGLATALTALITIRPTVRKANAAAETVRIDNVDNATHILIENIVEPLKEELNATRKDLHANKREMARLRKAIDTANSCRHHDDCPVLGGLRKQQEEHDGGEDTDGNGKRRQRERKSTGGTGDGGDTGEFGEADYTGGQPP